MPRLSIIIPLRSNLELFEATLVSVLENRPDECEVIVAHDGSYDDPFDLAGEVCFAVADDQALVNLVWAATQIATSPVVHVLADGFLASEDWTRAAVDAFDDEEVQCATPLICDQESDHTILAAGWTDDRLRLRRSIAEGATAVGRLEQQRVRGVYFAASFWHIALLRKCLKSIAVDSAIEFEALFARWMEEERKQIHILSESRVFTSSQAPELQSVGYREGFQLQCAAQSRGFAATAGFALLACITRPHRVESWATAIGRLSAGLMGTKYRTMLDRNYESLAAAHRPNDESNAQTLAFPTHQPLRQAA
ncbi:MAG: glycosyltransferase family 2 protein [Pirellulaceae bacterium]